MRCVRTTSWICLGLVLIPGTGRQLFGEPAVAHQPDGRVELHQADRSTAGPLISSRATSIRMAEMPLGQLAGLYVFFKRMFKNDPSTGLLVCLVGFGAAMLIIELLRRMMADGRRRRSSRRAGPIGAYAAPRCPPGQHDLIPAGEAHEQVTSSGVKRESNFKCSRCRYRTWIPQELLTDEQKTALQAIGLTGPEPSMEAGKEEVGSPE